MKPLKSTIYLIRHGITEGNKKMWHYGWSDIPLLPEGIEKLKEYKAENVYPKIEDADFYTSGLLRTEMTLETIFGPQDHKVIEGLKEINFGEFEKKTYDDLKDDPRYQAWIMDKDGKAQLPGGDSKQSFGTRVLKGFDQVVSYHRLKELSHRHDRQDANSVVVCHGGVIGCIMLTHFGSDWSEFSSWIPKPGRGYAVTMEDGKPVSYIKL